MNTSMPSQLPTGRTRRRHSKEFKAELVGQCQGLGVSMAAVAMSHGINANVLRRWVSEANARALQPMATESDTAAPAVPAQSAGGIPSVAAQATFVPVRVEMPASSDIHIEITRGNLQVKVIWPLSAASHSAQWLRELLR